MKFSIYWKSLITGIEGHGTSIVSENVGKRLITTLNEKYKGIITHWLVPDK